MLKMKDMCVKINSLPTVLGTVRLGRVLRVVVSYAQYDRAVDEGTITFYHGPMESAIGMRMIPDRYHSPDQEWVSDIGFRGESNGLSEPEPLLSEYDWAPTPWDMPLWLARAWVRRQKASLSAVEVGGRREKKLMRVIQDAEMDIGADETAMETESRESLKGFVHSALKKQGVK